MIQQKLQSLQLKHLVQITICVLAIYLLRARKTYQLVPLWRKDLDPGQYRNGQFPHDDEKLPAPIFTDLDGDGTLEAIFITTDLKIEICQVPRDEEDATGFTLPYMKVLHSVSLPQKTDNGPIQGRPVVMETGFIDQYTSSSQRRSQMLVVVYSSWYVVCYDHTLSVLWEDAVMDISSGQGEYTVQSMGVLVSPHSIQKGDRGLVIVGASYKHKHHHARKLDLQEKMDTKDDSEPGEDTVFTKFSTFAFSGGNGTSRWYHFPESTEQRVQSEDSAHHWKLSLKRGHWPHGKVHWSRFGTYLLQHMPHKWRDVKDTKFDLGNIRKLLPDELDPPSPDPTILVDLDLQGHHRVGETFGGMRAHSRHEHVSNPTAVVIHHDLGLEILSLQSGQLITDLRMENHDAIYADINQDGNLDEVRVNFAGICRGEASTIHPRPRAIFADNICEDDTWWSGVESDVIPDENEAKVPPVVVKSVARPRGLLNHLLGKALPREQKGYDSIFVTSAGLVTSFNQRGHKNWKTRLPLKWSNRLAEVDIHDQFGTHRLFTPSLVAMALQVYGPEKSALISGWDKIVLLHLEDGFIDGQHSLPCQPIDEPIIVDFNSDGCNDIVVTCPTGYVGFAVMSQPQYLYLAALSVTIVLFMLLLSWCCQQEPDDMEQYDDS